MHAPDAATRAARLSPRLEAAQHLLKQSSLSSSLPSSRLLCMPLSGARLCRKAAHACSDCACLLALPDKLRHCTTVVGPLTSECTASTLPLRRPTNFTQKLTTAMQHSGPGRPLNRPTTRRCSYLVAQATETTVHGVRVGLVVVFATERYLGARSTRMVDTYLDRPDSYARTFCVHRVDAESLYFSE